MKLFRWKIVNLHLRLECTINSPGRALPEDWLSQRAPPWSTRPDNETSRRPSRARAAGRWWRSSCFDDASSCRRSRLNRPRSLYRVPRRCRRRWSCSCSHLEPTGVVRSPRKRSLRLIGTVMVIDLSSPSYYLYYPRIMPAITSVVTLISDVRAEFRDRVHPSRPYVFHLFANFSFDVAFKLADWKINSLWRKNNWIFFSFYRWYFFLLQNVEHLIYSKSRESNDFQRFANSLRRCIIQI